MKFIRKKLERKRPSLYSINILSVLRKVGVRVRGLESEWYTCWCPFHPDGDHPNLRVNPRGGVFRCFACAATGNILHIIEHTQHCSRADAWALLSDTGVTAVSLQDVRQRVDDLEREKHKELITSIADALQSLYNLIRQPESHTQMLLKLHNDNDVAGFMMRTEPDAIFANQLVDALAKYGDEVCQDIRHGKEPQYQNFMLRMLSLWNCLSAFGYIKSRSFRVVPDYKWNTLTNYYRQFLLVASPKASA